MKRIMIAGPCLLAALCATAEATYTYEEDGKALVVTVMDGDETLTSDAAAVLQANEITNFYKRGTGRLLMTSVSPWAR